MCFKFSRKRVALPGYARLVTDDRRGLLTVFHQEFD